MDANAEFAELCTKLGVTQNMQTTAWETWKELATKNAADFQPTPMKWLACLLYVASIDARFPYGLSDPQVHNGSSDTHHLNTTMLLKQVDMNMAEFCQKLRILKERVPLSDSAQESITMLQRNYLICVAVFHKFERIFKEVFQQEQTDVQSENMHSNEEEKVSYKRKLVWTLFVLAKEVILGSNQQVISSFHLLLCALDYVIHFTPSFQLNPPFDEVHRENSGDSQTADAMKQFLCQHYGASIDDLKAVNESWTVNLVLPAGNKLQELSVVQKQYKETTACSWDFDELAFLDRNPILLPDTVPQEQSALHRNILATPVRTALNTLQQLQHILERSVHDGPSTVLKHYFQKCPKNPEKSIQDRLSVLEEKFMSSIQIVMGRNYARVAQHRFKMAVQLHFKVMEALLKSEEERLSVQDFSNLLQKESFHSSLLACAIEVVLTTYKTSGNSSPTLNIIQDSSDPTAFPWILQVFDLKAYNFFKVLESFVKAEPRLPREIVRHLQNMENRILESVAWEENSPLYEAMRVSEITSIQVPFVGEIEEPTSSIPPYDLFMSPTPQRNGSRVQGTNEVPPTTQQNGSSIQSTQPLPPKTKKSHSLNLFLNKVARLGYNRLLSLCTKLSLAKDLTHKIWTCFEYCFSHRPDLMKNRHLDQIMMCSVYAICKVVDEEVKFRTIVSKYKLLPHVTTPDVYKAVLIQGTSYDSIILFYNNVFMHRTKSFILQFSPSRQNQGHPVLSPAPKAVTSPLTHSPVYTLPGKKNFFVSPMKESPFKPPVLLTPSKMTPRTRQLYSFGESIGSGEKLQKINETMRALKSKQPSVGFATSKRQKKLTFDNTEDSQSNNNDEQSRSEEVRDIVARKAVELASAFKTENDEN